MNRDSLVFKLDVTLLEDLHSGAGTGNIVVDALQARNADGFPVIDHEHFRGVLKDNALRLCRLGLLEEKEIDRLFGKSGGWQRSLDCSSLVADQKDCVVKWSSTARRPGSRCPEDHSLRRIESIKAGTVLRGSIQIDAPASDDHKLLAHLLQFTTRLGGGRTRGDGQIQITWGEKPTVEDVTQNLADDKKPSLRLLLQARESLCIPATGHPGNIIDSESHIPGRTLFAALCQAMGPPELKRLFTPALRVGNALPVPGVVVADEDALASAQVMPMPAHLYRLKPAVAVNPLPTSKTGAAWPHWAEHASGDGLPPELQQGRDVDYLAYRGNVKTSRPKGHLYLIRDSEGKWRHYRQSMEIRMRNRRGDPFAKNLKRSDTALFTVERIPAGTRFVSDIRCDDEALRARLWPLLSKGSVFRIGRGKAAVEIVGVQTVSAKTEVPAELGDSLTVIAQSDWLVLGDNLGYLTELNKETFLQAFDIDMRAERFAGVTLEACQETEIQGSFNHATALPRLPQAVIRRGSAFRLSGKQALLRELATLLTNHGPIGERVTEGYGQFVIEPELPSFLRADDANPLPDAMAEAPEKVTLRQDDKNDVALHLEQSSTNDQASPLVEDPACVEAAYNRAAAYYQEHLSAIRDQRPALDEWKRLKTALLESETPMIVINGQPEAIQQLFHRQLRSNSLFQYIVKLKPPNNCDQTFFLTAFLDDLEKRLYGEASV